MTARLDALARTAPDPLDLTDPDHQEALRLAAERLEADAATAAELQSLEESVVGQVPLAVRLALKLAASRRRLREIGSPVHVSVVFAMYKEHVRILPRDEHPRGEDFLRRKLAQLRWLFAPVPRHSWDLVAVDDGCPEGSGRLARAVLEESGRDVEARVLFLDDAIREGLPTARALASTRDSRKGGSIRLGLWNATRTPRGESHVVLFTDADLSTHLGQAGLLVAPIAAGSMNAAIGSRREPTSIAVKQGKRNLRGKLFIYLWKRLVHDLRDVIDTQCGFKAFRASHLAGWIEDTVENGFAFDIEFLIQVQSRDPGSITKVPIAWIDSEAESTTTDLEPYLPMLKSVVRFYRSYLPSEPAAEGFARFIESLDAESFRRLLENIPEEITSREPLEFDAFDSVTVDDLLARTLPSR